MAGILKVDQVQSDSNLAFKIGSSNVAYFNTTGLNVTGGEIIAGGSTLRTTGGLIYANNGIAFPATQVPSSDANTLDDYEEGTFTPTIGGSGGDPTVTYSSQQGLYTKVGRLVIARIQITVTAISGGSGYSVIRGLPFTNSGQEAAGSVGYSDLWSITTSPSAIHVASTNSIMYTYYRNSSDARSQLTLANVCGDLQNGTKYLYTTVVYQATA